jgi:hypothetical protein
MKPTENDKHELIKLCKDLYKNNDVQLALVNEFEREYTSSRALWWYTRESFVYRMLNKALRIQNIELLNLFRFVIGDIYQLFQRNQCQSSAHVYRGQVISTDELNTLQHLMGKFVSISSFFSTSRNRHKAIEFLNNWDDSNDLHRILFIINADPHVVKSKPFANVSQFSDNDSESEVLFMTGCVFRLMKIDQNDDNIWIIRMQLCDDDQHNLKTLFNHMKKEYGW